MRCLRSRAVFVRSSIDVVVGLEEGIRAFDSCLAGLGGCPYAPGASGNVVTEDLVFMLESMGFATGIDLQKLIDFTKNWRFVLFAGALVLFHLCNASLLPLVSENLPHSKVANSSLFMGGLIVVPQVVVAILAPWIGYWSELWGRKPLLLTGFIIEVARSLLFALVSDPLLMMVVQLLDGVTGATVTVLTILVITDLTPARGGSIWRKVYSGRCAA